MSTRRGATARLLPSAFRPGRMSILLNQDLRKGFIYSALVRYEVRNSSREAFAPLGVSKTHPTNSVHG